MKKICLFDIEEDRIVNEYFNWLIDRVDVNIGNNPEKSYAMLMRTLHKKDFYWLIELDSNRAVDGTGLREVFADEFGIRDIQCLMRPCSILEMMVALSARIERDLMSDSWDDNSPKWFWDMIKNLGLDIYSDKYFDYETVDYILDNWLSRYFSKNGIGSPFPVKSSRRDMRNIQIWSMMQAYYIEKYDEDYELYG